MMVASVCAAQPAILNPTWTMSLSPSAHVKLHASADLISVSRLDSLEFYDV
ncbi:MAG: hypothetical protein SGJ05_01720 [bacterium]|nr:hypothetical protein [bacterium]